MPRYAFGDTYETSSTDLIGVADHPSHAHAIAWYTADLEENFPENGRAFVVDADDFTFGPYTITLVRDDFPLDSTSLQEGDLIQTVAILDQPGPDTEI